MKKNNRHAKNAGKKATRTTKKTERKASRLVKKTARKAKIKTVSSKLKKRIKKVTSKVAAVTLEPLIPFKSTIYGILKSKGINTSKLTFDEAVKQFYNMIVAKKNGFEQIPDYIDLGTDNLVSDIASIVATVLNFIKNVKDRKKAGEQLTPTEERIALKAEKVERDLTDKQIISDEKALGVINEGDTKKNKDNNMMLFILVAVLAFFVFKKA